MKYSVFYHTVNGESDLSSFLSAGIVIENDVCHEIKRIYDVSIEFDALEKLVSSLNDGNVAPEHLDAILDDYYSEHC